MERQQLIDIFNSHKKVFFVDVTDTELENLADHVLAAVRAHYEKLESELRVKNLTLETFGIHHD